MVQATIYYRVLHWWTLRQNVKTAGLIYIAQILIKTHNRQQQHLGVYKPLVTAIVYAYVVKTFILYSSGMAD